MPNTVHIGNVIRNAIVFNCRKSDAEVMHADGLLEAVAQLFTLLHERQIDYLLVSGVAMLHYVQGRNTEDIDLIISVSSLQALPEIALTSQKNNFARGAFAMVSVWKRTLLS
jgi:hypothetical protein